MAKKRMGWFQLRLSTCVVLMLVAGVFVCLNLKARTVGDQPEDIGYGWPVICSPESALRGEPFGPLDLFPWWRVAAVTLDVLFFLISLAWVTLTLECAPGYLAKLRSRRSN